MKNKTYDILKVVAMCVLPALATCVTTIFEIWELPLGAQIGATIMAIDTLLGAMLGISNAKYKKENNKETLEELSNGMEEGEE